MGDVVDLTTVHRPPSRRRVDRRDVAGDILLFTGVRIERRIDEGDIERPGPQDPFAGTPPRRFGD